MGTFYNVLYSGRDRAVWLQHRLSGLGASEIGAVLGINPFCSALEVYGEKVIGEPLEDFASDVAEFGLFYEDELARRLSVKYGWKVVKEGRLLASKSRPWQRATLDYVVYDDEHGDEPGLLELKTTGFNWSEDGVPAYVGFQTDQQLAVSGFKWGFTGIMERIRCNAYALPMDVSEERIAFVNEEGERFWRDHVEKRIPPPADGSESAKRMIAKLYPEVDEIAKPVRLPAEALAWVRDWEAGKEVEKDGVATARLAQNLLRQALDGRPFGELPGGAGVTNKFQTSVSTATCPSCDIEFETNRSRFQVLRQTTNLKRAMLDEAKKRAKFAREKEQSPETMISETETLADVEARIEASKPPKKARAKKGAKTK